MFYLLWAGDCEHFGYVLLIEKDVGLSICKQNWIYYKSEKGLMNFDFPLITSAAHMRASSCSDIFHGVCFQIETWGLQRASLKVNIWLTIWNKSVRSLGHSKNNNNNKKYTQKNKQKTCVWLVTFVCFSEHPYYTFREGSYSPNPMWFHYPDSWRQCWIGMLSVYLWFLRSIFQKQYGENKVTPFIFPESTKHILYKI